MGRNPWGDARVIFDIKPDQSYGGKPHLIIKGKAQSRCGKEFTLERKRIPKNREYGNKDKIAESLRSRIAKHSDDCSKCKALGWSR